jgi:hypothetical protein
MTKSIKHTLNFEQGSGANSKWLEFELTGDSDLVANPKKVEGAHLRWRLRSSDPTIDLYPNFTAEDKARLQWRWDSSEHGGLIQLGIDTPTETVRGRTTKSYLGSGSVSVAPNDWQQENSALKGTTPPRGTSTRKLKGLVCMNFRAVLTRSKRGKVNGGPRAISMPRRPE